MRTTLRAALTACVCVTGLAACGSGSDAGTSRSQPGPGASGTTAMSTPGQAGQTGQAPQTGQTSRATLPLSRVVLQREDIPAAYRHKVADANSGADRAADDALHACLGVASTTGRRVGSAASASFGTEAVGIASGTSRYSSQDVVDSDSALFRAPKAQVCYKKFVTSQSGGFTKGLALDSFELRPGSNDGPSNVTAILSAEYSGKGNGGASVTFSIEIIYMSGPKLVTQLDLLGFGAAVPGDLATKLEYAVAASTAKG